MKFSKNWKRIIAGFMAAAMVFLSIDGGCLTALAAEIQELNNEKYVERPTGYHSLEMIIVNENVFDGEVYHYEELAEVQAYSTEYNNEWDKFATYFYYNQMSDEWKKVWNALDLMCLEYLVDSKVATREEIEGVECVFMDPISLPENTTYDDLKLLVELFLNSNPQYYFLNNMYLASSNGDQENPAPIAFALCLYEKFETSQARADATKDFKDAIDAVYALDEVKEATTDSQKLRVLHDYIVKHVDYNHTITTDNPETEDNESVITDEEDKEAISQSAYSALCMNQTTVCAGYAEALSLLCNGLGVDVATVTSANHMWNKVRIEDSWYNVDATWADQDSVLYNYYGRSDKVYDEDDSEEYAYSHTELEMWQGYLPLCTLDATPESPYDEPGAFPEIKESAPIPKILASETDSGDYIIMINPSSINVSNPASIYYTTDGTVPSVASSKATKYTGPFVVEEDYDIRAICVSNGCYDSAVVRGVQVPTVANVDVDDRFYNKVIVSWESVGDKVDGYEIVVLNEETKEEIESVLVDKTQSSYTVDTSECEPGTKLQVQVCSYIGDETNMQRSGEYIVVGNSVKAVPLSGVDFTWFVRTWRNTNCLAINLETGYQLYHYLETTGVDEYDSGFNIPTIDGVEHFYLFDPEFVPYDQKGYVIVCDEDVTTAWQEMGVLVGGEFSAPILQPIADVSFTATGQSATLSAIITNPMKNFDYRYQWYVADTPEGEATAIENATTSTYVVTVDADETKYYFCRVTTEYGEVSYVDTNNGAGQRTAVSGSMVGADVQIAPIKNQTYTSLDITPGVMVTVNGATLTKDVDYTVTYIDNKNVGTATVIVTFCGNYTGTKSTTFEIIPADVENISVANIPSQVYTGDKITPELTVTGIKGESLEKGIDYVLTYGENKNVGQASVNLTFIKNYSGTIHFAFQIVPKTLNADNVLAEEQTYTGSELLHKLTVTDGSFTLEEGKDYKVVYADDVDNINAGEVPLTVEFIGNYTGVANVSFIINPKSAEDLQITVEEQTYTGSDLTTNVVVMDGETVLEEDIDYEVAYSNNINASTPDNMAKVIVTFMGNYTGVREAEFKINPREATNCTVTLEKLESYIFTGEAFVPEVIVNDGEKVLVEDKEGQVGDFTVTYTNNINAGEATVIVEFKNNYTGSIYTTFNILPIEVTDAVISVIADQIYTGKEIVPDFTVTSEVLEYTFVKDTDYTVTVENAKNVGEATVIAKFTGNYSGIVETKFNIKPRTTDNVVISEIPNQTYTGKAITPELEIKDVVDNIVLVKDQDYTVEFQNNVEEGTATVIVSFTGNFTGESMTTTFTIIDPVPTSITSSVFTVSQSNGYISKITVGTTKYTLWSAFNEKDYVEIYDKAGAIVSNDKVLATGMTAGIIDEGAVTKRYTIIVTGDTNGDGKINITDMIAVKACTLKKSGLSGAYEKAGDVNGDGKINITDFIKVKATTLKKDTIVGVSVN